MINGDRLLVCHTKGAENTYLPGGHVEFGERAADALAREILEELSMKAKVGRFLGAVEHSFLQKGEKHCEVNLVFEMEIPGLDSKMKPSAAEDHIEFSWLDAAGLETSDLEPSPLRGSVAAWIRRDAGSVNWASSM